MTAPRSQGVVTLVGAGPGDPGLLTLKGLAALERCDVVLYDSLIGDTVLDLVPEGVELIYVGKTGAHSGADDRQRHIHEVMIERALSGQAVVRLTGGDPFVFGRGGEEAEALRAAGVAFEVVPGVSAAVAVPAYAGIPVTHRGFNTALAVVTGHEDPRLPSARTNWRALASLAAAGGTLVILMGVKNLDRNARFLLDEGVDPSTPAALVQWGSLPRQRTLVGTLETIAAERAARSFGPPAVCVIGPVAALHETLSWFEPGPLAGRRVLVTRALDTSASLVEPLRRLGASPVILPTIEVRDTLDPALDAAVRRLSGFAWVALTSANGVRALMAAVERAGLDARAFAGCRLACVGEATARALREAGLKADLVPAVATAEALALAMIEAGVGGPVLAPLAAGARDTLPTLLGEHGAQIEVIAAYRTAAPAVVPARPMALLRAGKIDAATFASPSAIHHLAQMAAPTPLPELLGRAKVLCIGPVTAREAQKIGLAVDVVPEAHSAEAMIEALVAHFASGAIAG